MCQEPAQLKLGTKTTEGERTTDLVQERTKKAIARTIGGRYQWSTSIVLEVDLVLKHINKGQHDPLPTPGRSVNVSEAAESIRRQFESSIVRISQYRE